MTQETSSRDKTLVNVGTIGPPGSGKTMLIAAILQQQAQSNLAQAVSYDAIQKGDIDSFEYETANRHYTHFDYDGAGGSMTDLIDNVAQLDGVILVVSVSEGVMQQTRQQVRLARQLGVGSLIVFFNKCDAFDDDVLNMVEMQVRELLTKETFDGANVPVIRGAAQSALGGDAAWQQSIDQLLGALDSRIPDPAVRAEAVPATPHKKFEGDVYLLNREEGGQRGTFTADDRPQLYISSTSVRGTVKFPDGVTMAMPGDHITLTIELDTPVAIAAQLPFAVFAADDDDDDGDDSDDDSDDLDDAQIIGVGIVTTILS